MIVDLAIECKQYCIFSIRHNGYCLFPPLFTFEKYLFRYQQHEKLPAYKCAQLHYGCPCQNQPFLPQIVQKFEAVTALQLNKQDSPISTACELLSRAAPCIPAPVKGRKPWLCTASVCSLCALLGGYCSPCTLLILKLLSNDMYEQNVYTICFCLLIQIKRNAIYLAILWSPQNTMNSSFKFLVQNR